MVKTENEAKYSDLGEDVRIKPVKIQLNRENVEEVRDFFLEHIHTVFKNR